MSKKPKANPGDPDRADRWKKIARNVAIGAVVVLIVGAIALSSDPLKGVPEGTQELEVGAAEHVEGDLHEEGEVPAGGAHSAAWQNCGVYDTAIRSENAVHSLEHGAVWLTYRPEIGDDAIRRLEGFAGPGEKVIVSPNPSQAPLILATAWANQLELENAGDARLNQFVAEFKASIDAPEPGGLCTGGVGSPIG